MNQSLSAGVVLLALAGTAVGQWSDDFNRPDGPIGGDWTVVSGTWAIAGMQGTHTSSNPNEILQHNLASETYSDSVQWLDVFSGSASQFSAVVVGLGGADAILVKIQDQVTGTPGFSHIGIYHRVGSSFSSWTGTTTIPGGGTSTSGFAAIPAGREFISARMKVSFPDPNLLQLDIDTDFNGTPDMTYTRDNVLSIAAGLGTGFGISGWGNTARFDNWQVGPEVLPCYPDCDTSTGVGVLDIFDFLCFQNRYDVGSPYACDCDTSTGVGVCDIFDFICFQNAYAAGCP